MRTTDVLLVSIDFTHGSGKDAGVLVVGRRCGGKVDIINAFKGEEATGIYEKLTTGGISKVINK